MAVVQEVAIIQSCDESINAEGVLKYMCSEEVAARHGLPVDIGEK